MFWFWNSLASGSLPDFAAFARHGFQKEQGGLVRTQGFIEQADNPVDAGFHALPYMAAGMEIIILVR